MKKLLALLMAGAMTLSLFACGNQASTSSSGSTSGSGSQSTENTGDGVWSPVDANGNTKRDERDATSENGMVASSNVYATMAGLKVLEEGGNAVDAAVAVSYALGVAEPYTSGLGGGGFMLIHTADGQNKFIDYREVASAGQDAYTWLDENGEMISDTASTIGGRAA